MIFTPHSKRKEAGFIISIEYILVATLLTLCFVIFVQSRIQQAVWIQITSLDPAVVVMDRDPGPVGGEEPAPPVGLPTTYSVNFATPDGFGGFTQNDATSRVNGTRQPVWQESTSLLFPVNDGLLGIIEKNVNGASGKSLLTSPLFTATDNVNVTIGQRFSDPDEVGVSSIYYEVNGGGFDLVPIEWFTSGGYNDTDHWSGNANYDERLLTNPTMFTSAGVLPGDSLQFRFQFDSESGSKSVSEWMLYDFEVDNVVALPATP